MFQQVDRVNGTQSHPAWHYACSPSLSATSTDSCSDPVFSSQSGKANTIVAESTQTSVRSDQSENAPVSADPEQHFSEFPSYNVLTLNTMSNSSQQYSLGSNTNRECVNHGTESLNLGPSRCEDQPVFDVCDTISLNNIDLPYFSSPSDSKTANPTFLRPSFYFCSFIYVSICFVLHLIYNFFLYLMH